MAQLHMVEGQTEIKSPSAKFFDVFARKLYLVGDMSPNRLPKIELQEGDWHSIGAVTIWNYVVGGERGFVTAKTEEIIDDEGTKSVSYTITDGEIMKHYYKSLKSKIEVIPNKLTNISMVKWTVWVEKMNEDTPDPDVYLQNLLNAMKDVGVCLNRNV